MSTPPPPPSPTQYYQPRPGAPAQYNQQGQMPQAVKYYPPGSGAPEQAPQQGQPVQAPLQYYQHGIPQPSQPQQKMPPSQPPKAPPPEPTPSTVSSSIPPGLEALVSLGQVYIRQSKEGLDRFSDYEQENAFYLYNPLVPDVIIYSAEEESESCQRQAFATKRSFVMNIEDRRGNGFMLDKPCTCILSHDSYSKRLRRGVWNNSGTRFHLYDGSGQLVFIIKGPYRTCSCGGEIDFKIVSALNLNFECGQITKNWAGFNQEIYTHCDNFTISFPVDLSVKLKAVIIGACILIDYKFFEHQCRDCCCE